MAESNELSLMSNMIDDMISMSHYQDNLNERSSEKSVTTCNQTNDEQSQSIFSRFSQVQDLVRRLSWKSSDSEKLALAEIKVLNTLKSKYDGCFVPVSNNTEKIWTIYSNLQSTKIPIVLLHGFGGGVGLWSLNLDELCAENPVYAFDLPGFGRSSRPTFSKDPSEAERTFINMIEDWRKEMQLNKPFILVGHSFGGFLSTAYTINYPKFVEKLILVDPWGFSKKPDDWETSPMQRIPPWLRLFSSLILKFGPLSPLRAAGPLAVPAMKRVRSDLRLKFEKLFGDDTILTYLYHCNAQPPTGEAAFLSISDTLAWAKYPMIDRIHLVDEQIPIYFLHGERSWIDINSSFDIQSKRNNVYVNTIVDAGHHVYADTPGIFNDCVKQILTL